MTGRHTDTSSVETNTGIKGDIFVREFVETGSKDGTVFFEGVLDDGTRNRGIFNRTEPKGVAFSIGERVVAGIDNFRDGFKKII